MSNETHVTHTIKINYNIDKINFKVACCGIDTVSLYDYSGVSISDYPLDSIALAHPRMPEEGEDRERPAKLSNVMSNNPTLVDFGTSKMKGISLH